MSFYKLARAWLRANASRFAPQGATPFQMAFVTKTLDVNSAGFRVDRPAFSGRVIHVSDALTVVQTSEHSFTAIDPELLRTPLREGFLVAGTPYQRRHFDGRTFLDAVQAGPRPAEEPLAGKRFGSCVSPLPLLEPASACLMDLRDLIHRGRCTDGIRVISNMLVDFKSTSMAWHEPVPEHLDPELRFDCSTGRFTGPVRIGLSSSDETYFVELLKRGQDGCEAVVHSCRRISWHQLAQVLECLLCDGEWKFCQVQVLERRVRVRGRHRRQPAHSHEAALA